MTRRTRNRIRMLRATLAHFDAHPDAWSAEPPVGRALAPVRGTYEAMEAAAQAQTDAATQGLTEDKGDARRDATKRLVLLGKRAAGHAHETGDDDLLRAVDFSESDWDDLPDERFVAQARTTLDRIEGVLAALTEYKVTAGDLAAARADLADFLRLSGVRDTTGATGTSATADLGALYSGVVEPLAQLDRTVDSLVEDPAFVAKYHVVRRIPGD